MAKQRKTIAKNRIFEQLFEPFTEKRPASFWIKETQSFNRLFEKYPNLDFWEKVTFTFKVPTLSWLESGKSAKKLELKWQDFNFKPEKTVIDHIYDDTTYRSESIEYKRGRGKTLLEILS